MIYTLTVETLERHNSDSIVDSNQSNVITSLTVVP